MTNYNERLNKILEDFYDGDIRQSDMGKAKAAFTSLVEELVEEVIGEDEWSGIFPALGESSAMRDDLRADQRTRLQSILKREFEQNLLKALEEV